MTVLPAIVIAEGIVGALFSIAASLERMAEFSPELQKIANRVIK